METAISVHNKITLNNLTVGDLVEFVRNKAYSHWAVYIGDNQIVHLAGEENDGLNADSRPEHLFTISGKHFNKAVVAIDDFFDVAANSRAFKNNATDRKRSPYSAIEIAQRAKSRLGEVGYSLMYKNCEHFAKWCRYGVHESDQVSNVLTGAAIGLAGGLVVGLIHAVTKYWKPTKEEEEEEESE